MSVSSNEATREQPEEQITLENPDVCTKYRTAADIANKALQSVLTACKEGADIFELCKLGIKKNTVFTSESVI